MNRSPDSHFETLAVAGYLEDREAIETLGPVGRRQRGSLVRKALIAYLGRHGFGGA